MTPEKNNLNNSSINTEAWSHTGKLQGKLQELPLTEDAPSVQDVTTGEIPKLVPHSSGELILEEQEIGPFQEKLAGLRESHTNPTEDTITEQDLPPKRRGKIALAIGGIAAVGAAAALFLLPKGDAGNSTENTPSPTQPVATAEATPTPTASTEMKPTQSTTPEAPKTNAELIKSLEIKSGQSPEALGRNIIDSLSKWYMAGSEKATVDGLLDAGYSGKEGNQYALKLASEQAPIYAEAIFGKNWAANPNVARYISGSEAVNADALAHRIITSEDPQPSMEYVEFTSVEASDDTSKGSIIILAKERDNIQETRLAGMGVKSENGVAIIHTATFHTEDGHIVIDSITKGFAK